MSIFSTRKPRSFSHKPIYWDIRKEQMDERKRKIESEGLSTEETLERRKEQLRGKFIQTSNHLNKKRKTAVSSFSFAKTFSVIILLITLIYFLWFGR